MRFENSNKYGSLVPEELIAHIEKTGLTLPEDYQDYLFAHNGGAPQPKDFKISETDGLSSVHVLYGFNEGPNWQNLLKISLAFKDRMPSEVLPVGSDDAGNQIVICCAGQNQGSVWF